MPRGRRREAAAATTRSALADAHDGEPADRRRDARTVAPRWICRPAQLLVATLRVRGVSIGALVVSSSVALDARGAGGARRAGQPGRAGRRRRPHAEDVAPPLERGPLRLAGRQLDRPDLRARRARRRCSTRAPRSTGAGSRRRRCRGHAGFDCCCARPTARGCAAARPDRPIARRPAHDGVLAASTPTADRPSSSCSTTEPAGRPARARHRAQRPRHQRAQGVRGAALAPGLPRPGHRPCQPRACSATASRSRSAARARPATGVAPDVPRPRRFQDGQRQPRARGGRPDAAARWRAAAGAASGPTTRWPASAATSSRSCSSTLAGVQEAADVAERILDALQEPMRVGAKRDRTRAPASASAWPSPARRRPTPTSCCGTPTSRCTWPSATARAATALFEPAMHAALLERLEMRADLQHAIDAGPARGALPAGDAAERRGGLRRRGAAALAPPRARADPAAPSSSRWPRRPA